MINNEYNNLFVVKGISTKDMPSIAVKCKESLPNDNEVTFQTIIDSEYMYNYLENNEIIKQDPSINIKDNIKKANSNKEREQYRMSPFVHTINKQICSLIGNNYEFGPLKGFEHGTKKKADIVYKNVIIENQLNNADFDHISRLEYYSIQHSLSCDTILIAEEFSSNILDYARYISKRADGNLHLFTVRTKNRINEEHLDSFNFDEKYIDINFGHPTHDIRLSKIEYLSTNSQTNKHSVSVSRSFTHLNTDEKFQTIHDITAHLPTNNKNYHLKENIKHLYTIGVDDKISISAKNPKNDPLLGESRYIPDSISLKIINDLNIDWLDSENHFLIFHSIELWHMLTVEKFILSKDCTLVISDEYDKRKVLCEKLKIEYIYLAQYRDPEFMRHFKKDKKLHIIGNPPYQDMSEGGSGKNMYADIVNIAKGLNPENISLIIGARWFTSTDDKVLNNFRNTMLTDNHLSSMTHYPISSECFDDTDIEGGVVYFHWDKQHNSSNCSISRIVDGNEEVSTVDLDKLTYVIPSTRAISIVNKVKTSADFESISSSMLRSAFNIDTNYLKKNGFYDPNYSGTLYSHKEFPNSIKIYGAETSQPLLAKEEYGRSRFHGYIHEDEVQKDKPLITKYKVIVAEAYGSGDKSGRVIAKPTIIDNNSCCTKTFIILGSFDTKDKAENLSAYVETKLFRFLLSILKNTQHAPPGKYEFVPQLDMSIRWSDEKLYKKYNLSDDEINYIEHNIKEL